MPLVKSFAPIKKVQSVTKNVVSKLKDTFLPKESVAKARRKEVFGTESKAVVGSVIIGASAGAILAPVAIASAGGLKASATAIGNAIMGTSTSTKVLAVVATPLVAGTIAKDPTTITKTPASIISFESNLYGLAKEPSIEHAKKIVKDNPIVSTAVATAVVGAVGLSAAGLISSVSNTQAVKENTKLTKEVLENQISSTLDKTNIPNMNQILPSSNTNQLPAVLPSTNLSTNQPVTPQTQVLGKPAGTTRIVARHKTKKIQPVMNRINIYNQTKSLNIRGANRCYHG